MLPATIKVAPNSPSARAKASNSPARMPRQASGSVTRKNTAASRRPSERAASSSCGSTVSNAARAALNTSGNDTTAAAITAACQLKISRMPKCCSSQPPSGPCVPMSTSR